MLTAGNLIASPISKPLATISVGQSAYTFRAAGTSINTLYSGPGVGPKWPAMIDSSRHFFATSSLPGSDECLSGAESSKRAILVEKPTTTMTTE